MLQPIQPSDYNRSAVTVDSGYRQFDSDQSALFTLFQHLILSAGVFIHFEGTTSNIGDDQQCWL
jgi:hypothetical protein